MFQNSLSQETVVLSRRLFVNNLLYSFFRLNRKLDDVSDAERERTKRIVYSVMYGVGM